MFGGHAFLVHGHMAVGASSQGGLMVRIDPSDGERLTAEPGVHPFEMRGRTMTGWIGVDAAVLGGDDDLRRWVGHGVGYTRSLPPT